MQAEPRLKDGSDPKQGTSPVYFLCGWRAPIYRKIPINHTQENSKSTNEFCMAFPGGASGKKKNLPANAGDVRDTGLIPGLGRSPGGGHGNPFQYSCLEIPWTEEPDRQVTVHEVAQSWT